MTSADKIEKHIKDPAVDLTHDTELPDNARELAGHLLAHLGVWPDEVPEIMPVMEAFAQRQLDKLEANQHVTFEPGVIGPLVMKALQTPPAGKGQNAGRVAFTARHQLALDLGVENEPDPVSAAINMTTGKLIGHKGPDFVSITDDPRCVQTRNAQELSEVLLGYIGVDRNTLGRDISDAVETWTKKRMQDGPTEVDLHVLKGTIGLSVLAFNDGDEAGWPTAAAILAQNFKLDLNELTASYSGDVPGMSVVAPPVLALTR